MNTQTLAQLRGALRHIITFAGGYVVAQGKLSPEEGTAITGAVLTVGGILWSAFEKRQKGPPTNNTNQHESRPE